MVSGAGEQFIAQMNEQEDRAREAERYKREQNPVDSEDTARRRAIVAENEQRKMTYEGTDAEEVFGEEEGELCRLFIERMRSYDFPGSTLLFAKNEAAITQPSFWQKHVLKSTPPLPDVAADEFQIRGYPIGRVNVEEHTERDAYLCEDGKVRLCLTAYSIHYGGCYPHHTEIMDPKLRPLVYDIPLNPSTGKPVRIKPGDASLGGEAPLSTILLEFNFIVPDEATVST